MHKLVPLSWSQFIKKLRNHGFEGPYYGGKHPYMVKKDMVLTIPNPHKKDMGIDLLRRILKQAGISHQEWTC